MESNACLPGMNTAHQQMTTKKYFQPTSAKPMGAVCNTMRVAANWPKRLQPMPILLISVGKISETQRYIVVSQPVPWKAKYRKMKKMPNPFPTLLVVPA